MKMIIFVFIGLLTAVSSFSQANIQPVATVSLSGTEQITVGQLRTRVGVIDGNPQLRNRFLFELSQEMGRVPTDAEFNRRLRLYVLDQMINERLFLQAATRDRITVTENEIGQRLRAMMTEQIGRTPTAAEFDAAMRENGIAQRSGRDPEGPNREPLRNQMIIEKYIMHRKGSVLEAVRPPTAQEVQNQFNNQRLHFVRPETVEFVAIQIPFGEDAAAKTRARQRGEALIREIGSRVSVFDRLVDEATSPNANYHAGPGSLPRIPEIINELFGTEFINVAFNLNQGQVSRLIETRNDYLIIKVTRNLEQRNLSIDDPVPPHLLLQAGILPPQLFLQAGLDQRLSISIRDFITRVTTLQAQQLAEMRAQEDLITEFRTGRTFQIFEDRINW
jgi:hypothetical protein